MREKLQRIALAIAGLLFIAVAYYLYDTLRPRTFEERAAEIIHLEDRRQMTEQLITYAEDPSVILRQRAALAIGRIGAKGSAPVLLEMLTDSALDVASTAGFAIGLTPNSQYAEPLLEIAWELPASVAEEVVESAGRLADSSMTTAIDGLTGFLTHPSPEVRTAACLGLFRAGARSKVHDLITFFEGEPDPEVRHTVLYVLARLGAAEGSAIYKQYLAASDPYIRSLAVRGMAESTESDANQLLAMALNDRDLRVVSQAVTSLAARDGKGSIPDRLTEKLASESDEKLVVQMINALARLESDQGVPVVKGLFLEDISDNVLAAALTYLATVQKDRAVTTIDSVMSGAQSAYVRAAAVRAYALTENAGVISRLGESFGDEDPMVRAAAYAALTDLDSANIDHYIRKALDDADPVLVAYALGTIEGGQRQEYLPVMRTIMSRGDAVDVDIRRSILEALAPFIDSTGSDSTAMEILIAGILDHNYVIRKQAAEIYADVFDEDRSSMVPPVRNTISEANIVSAIKRYRVNPRAVLITDKGQIEFELRFDLAPLTVINFVNLTREGFYDGLIFHRVVPNFVVQGGDPRGDGWGGPAHFIRCEYSAEPYQRGTVGIATSGKDTGGSQFFIMHSPMPHLNGRYTIFGEVLEGMEVVDQIVRGDVIQKMMITEGSE